MTTDPSDKASPYAAELARLRRAYRELPERASLLPGSVQVLTINPTAKVLEMSWRGLSENAHGTADGQPGPVPGHEVLLLWLHPRDLRPRVRHAISDDLLALKIVAEGLDPDTLAGESGMPVGALDAVLEHAVRSGLLLAPPSRLARDPAVFKASREGDGEFLSTQTFTLQWHVTQACDLRCRHCYDRSDRDPLSTAEAVRVLDDLRSFCRDRNVQGAVSFTGGNPLLHPGFLDIYRAAVERNFGTAILGNPSPRKRIEEIAAIRMPHFFQVSLEGLREHNDSIRGEGHFDRTLAFLDVLRDLKVSSMVMLTLTAANRDQVLPLAELLRDRADAFHFNRLALFGEGAALAMTDPKEYRAFLDRYLEAAETNPVMGTKDNLINILLEERGADLFGGCAGYGCGAAFNFLTLLADGEVHACRKLPSLLGNIREQRFADLYDSDLAKRYRLGPSACAGCSVRIACGGCLASTLSHGRDIFTDKDPFCFKEQGTEASSQHPG